MMSGKYTQYLEPIGPFDGTNANLFVSRIPALCKIESGVLMYDDVGRWVEVPLGSIITTLGGIFSNEEEFNARYVKVIETVVPNQPDALT